MSGAFRLQPEVQEGLFMPFLKGCKSFIILLSALSSLALGACANTVEGAGQDIEHAGEAVQESVDGGY